MSNEFKCELCGEPMPEGEEMFKFHGYSGKCPKPPLNNPVPLSDLQEAKKQIVMLRGLLVRYRKETPAGNQPHMICNEVDEALDATQDLSGYILCDAEPVAKWKEVGWSDIPDGEPLYKAKELKK